MMGRTTMKRQLSVAAFAGLPLAIAMTAATLAKPVTFTSPSETSTLKKTPDQGYLKADLLCVTCHSRDYITTQPRGKGNEFWAASVNKMVTVYGAPIPEADRPLIVAYLAANY
jgi:hypothetical protein